MKIIVTGATGLIGSTLVPSLAAQGHDIVRLTRSKRRDSDIEWQPQAREIEPSIFSGADAVVHLAAERIYGRWTAQKKARIRASRVDVTRRLCEAMARSANPPRILLSASATGFYGDRGAEILSEDSAVGTSFLAGLCAAWEAATRPAQDAGVRVVHLRLGIVLTPHDGALRQMLPMFRLGLGGPLGSGRQFYSWISLPDATGAIEHALATETLGGAVNLVSPQPLRQRDFARVLGQFLHRPAVLPAPAFALRLALGEMAGELLLASARVEPARLLSSGYQFQYPTLPEALRALLSEEAD